MAEKVLVVEDSRTIRRLLESQLTRDGFEPVLTTCISEAREYLSEGMEFLCAILDYCLPDGQDGEVIDLILSHKIKSIVLTAHMDDDIRQQVLDKGVIDYIPKDSPASVAYITPLLKRLSANKKHTVLVVDDSRTIRNYLSSLLTQQYLNVVTANDGLQGLAELERHNITMVITDHDMPNMDGISMIREIRRHQNRNQLVILGVSGTCDESLTARFLKAGANDYVKKPFNQEEFYCRIHHMLNMKDTGDKLYALAHRDSLTGLWNRHHFFDFATKKAQSKRNCYAMLDIDFFKQVNDTYGHDGGDTVLEEMGRLLKNFFPNDLVARLGGEEFVIQSEMPLSDFTEQLEQMREKLENYSIAHGNDQICVTISIGVTEGVGCIEHLLKKADQNLYTAKNSGRNQCMVA